MILTAAAAAILLVMAPLTTLEAQERPDFSGSWTLAESQGGQQGQMGQQGQRGQQGQMGQRGQQGQRGQMGQRGGGMGMLAGFGQQATITHEGNVLTVVRTTPMGEMRQVYNLDGSESRNQMTMGNQQLELVSRASWDGDALVIVTPLPMGGQGETTMRLSVNEAGALVVETHRSGGMGGQGGGPMVSTYTKGG